MTFVPNENVIQLNCRYLWDSQECQNTLYAYFAGGWTYNDMYDTAAYLGNYIHNSFLPLQNYTLQLTGVVAQRLQYPTDLQASWVPSSTAIGGVGQDPAPNSVSIAVSLKTGYSGRSYHGRNYWMGLCDSQTIGNKVHPTVISNILAAYNGLIAGFLGDLAFPLVVYSRIGEGQPRTLGLASAITVATVANDIIDSQRRRLPGRGR